MVLSDGCWSSNRRRGHVATSLPLLSDSCLAANEFRPYRRRRGPGSARLRKIPGPRATHQLGMACGPRSDRFDQAVEPLIWMLASGPPPALSGALLAGLLVPSFGTHCVGAHCLIPKNLALAKEV